MDDVNDDAKGVYRRVEVLTGRGRRRRWSDEQKALVAAEAMVPGAVVAQIARRWQVCASQVFAWRCAALRAPSGKTPAIAPAFVPIVEATMIPARPPPLPAPSQVVEIEIGHDESQRLDVIPVQYRVIVTRRPKYACRACEGVVCQAPAPARLIEGGIPTEALVANVMVSRFADHQPLYRQAQIMARQGVALDRSTLAFWTGYAKALLGGYRGILQCDGYQAYKTLADPGGAPRALAFCWSHVRRGFYDLAKAGTAPIASEALARIAALYRIEAEIRGTTAEHRLSERQIRSRALVSDLFTWFEVQLVKLPARGPTAEAIHYALNHRHGLELFVDDGHIEIDSNTVERTMRPIALGRRNSLFAGSCGGAESWAIIASLLQTARLNGLDPYTWLNDVLERIVSGEVKSHELDQLLAWKWKARFEPANLAA